MDEKPETDWHLKYLYLKLELERAVEETDAQIAELQKKNKEQAERLEELTAIGKRLASFVPEWAKTDIGPGHFPTSYGTLTHEGDKTVIEQTKADLKALAQSTTQEVSDG